MSSKFKRIYWRIGLALNNYWPKTFHTFKSPSNLKRLLPKRTILIHFILLVVQQKNMFCHLSTLAMLTVNSSRIVNPFIQNYATSCVVDQPTLGATFPAVFICLYRPNIFFSSAKSTTILPS